jgi:anti-sigma B factor antagonist
VSQDACPRPVSPLVVPEIVTLPDEVDINNARRLGADLITAMRPGVSVVIADMTLTEFCDSSGIRHLLIARDYASENGIDLRVVVSSRAIRRTLGVMGVDTMLQLYPTLMAALSNKQPEGSPGEHEPALPAPSDSGRS